MSGIATAVLTFLSVLGPGTLIAGLIAWRKYGPEIRHLSADTRRTVAEAVAIEESAEDAHWQALIKTQTESLLQPLAAEVARLTQKSAEQDAKISELETVVKSIQRRYRLTLDALRAYIRYGLALVALLPADVPSPPPPAIPNEIADDM